MKPLTQRVRGQLFNQNNRLALLIDQEADALYLRYALVVRGPENPIFPAFVMDDWGQERNTLDIYEWIAKEGQRFPRSDVFGLEMDGSETQYFLRALETFYKFPVFVYPQPELPVPAGMALSRVILPECTDIILGTQFTRKCCGLNGFGFPQYPLHKIYVVD